MVFQAQAERHRRLQVEQQAVFVAACHPMQASADLEQRGFVAFKLLRFQVGEDAVLGQFMPVVPQIGRFGHPQNGVQVAQAAGGFFAVGLQCVGRIFKLGMALAQLQVFGQKKFLGMESAGQLGQQLRKVLCAAANVAHFQHRGLRGNVLLRQGQTFIDGAHAGANLQPRIPAGGDKSLQRWAQSGIVRRHQQQNVNVRIRKKLAAPITAHRHNGHLRWQARGRGQGQQLLIDQLGQALQQQAHRRATWGLQRSQQLRFVGLVALAQRSQRGSKGGGGGHRLAP